MAERRAVNKYYPPDWDPSKGSANRHQKSHPLRHRAKRIDEGILVIRFEMPYNIVCLKCENYIAMGVRYNAEKSKVGQYYTSPIFKFRMKCHLCDNFFEIQSDPAKFDYNILSGARKQVRPSYTEADTDGPQEIVIDEDDRKRRLTDAMFRLEKQAEDKIRGDSQLPRLHDIKRWRSRFEDSFTSNQLLRAQYRAKRKKIEETRAQSKKILQKASLQIPLVRSCESDKTEAGLILDQRKSERLRMSEVSRKLDILNQKIVLQKSMKKEKG